MSTLGAEDHSFAMTSLKLENFRGFESLTVEFSRGLNLIVATNGGGKSALLNAISISLSDFVCELGGQREAMSIEKSDVRLKKNPNGAMVAMTPTSLEARAILFGKAGIWQSSKKNLASKTSHNKSNFVKEECKTILNHIKNYANKKVENSPVLPLIAFYGTGRLWAERRKTNKKAEKAKNLSEQLGAYADCLTPSSNYRQFEIWFEVVSSQAISDSISEKNNAYQARDLISAVRNAVNEVLRPTGWTNISWNFTDGCVVAEHPEQGDLSVQLLSDGIQNLIALVADLAHRAARLNPHFGADAAIKTPGIVLIDEVDMHLHPSWQQLVVEQLQKTFPLVQFILTTHSHLVAATVPQKSILILSENSTVLSPDLQTEGCDSEFVLSQIFSVNSSPPVHIARLIEKYENQIQSKCENECIYRELLEHFGEEHHVILHLKSLIRIRNMKIQRESNINGSQNEKNR